MELFNSVNDIYNERRTRRKTAIGNVLRLQLFSLWNVFLWTFCFFLFCFRDIMIVDGADCGIFNNKSFVVMYYNLFIFLFAFCSTLNHGTLFNKCFVNCGSYLYMILKEMK